MHKRAAWPGGVALRKSNIQWTAQEKMRWLGELARAIDEAQQIVWRVAIIRGDSPRTSEIYGRLEAARDEVERLQRSASRHAKIELHQDWSELIGSLSEPAGALD